MTGAAVFAAILTTAASAAELPHYPVEENCRRFAEYAAAGATENRAMIRQACIDDQQQAYDRLKDDWAAIDNSDQARCLRMTNAAPNYRSLGLCVGRLRARRESGRHPGGPDAFRY